ncbi:MAG: hypothetical protein JNL05_10000 [Flavobacteriales bacterium]|nr:hypothetical protein [Flavobacteriales bacterium]
MRNPVLFALLVLSTTGAMAQTVILTETFESTNGQAPPPGWSWNGTAPTYVNGSGSNYAIQKESPDQSVPPPPLNGASWLFHPLPYDANWLYRVSGDMYVSGAGSTTAGAGAILCWMDLGTEQFATTGNSITSFSQFPFWQTQLGGWSTVGANIVGPNAQFGIMLTVQGPDGNSFGAFDNITVSYQLPSVFVQPRLWLDGAYDQGLNLMRDDLRVAGLIPATEPYSAMFGGTGGETVAPGVLAVTGNNAVVDWVRVELRASPTGPTVAAVHGLLQRDGDVVDVNGLSPLRFFVNNGLYHVVVRHRNHLPVMTASALSLSSATFPIDFRAPATTCHTLPAPQTDLPRKTVGTTRTLWAGDVSGNGTVSYVGAGNDRDLILLAIGGSTPSAVITGAYRSEDVNLDGSVKYTGTNNDRDIVLQTIGGLVPTAVRVAQVP